MMLGVRGKASLGGWGSTRKGRNSPKVSFTNFTLCLGQTVVQLHPSAMNHGIQNPLECPLRQAPEVTEPPTATFGVSVLMFATNCLRLSPSINHKYG